MSIVSFRPHTLYHIRSVGGAYDANGDWVPGGTERIGPVPCRFEPNGRAATISLPDGTNYTYHYTVYLDPDAGITPVYGDKVQFISQNDEFMGEYEVKGFHQYQLGLRIWV